MIVTFMTGIVAIVSHYLFTAELSYSLLNFDYFFSSYRLFVVLIEACVVHRQVVDVVPGNCQPGTPSTYCSVPHFFYLLSSTTNL